MVGNRRVRAVEVFAHHVRRLAPIRVRATGKAQRKVKRKAPVLRINTRCTAQYREIRSIGSIHRRHATDKVIRRIEQRIEASRKFRDVTEIRIFLACEIAFAQFCQALDPKEARHRCVMTCRHIANRRSLRQEGLVKVCARQRLRVMERKRDKGNG